MWFSQSSGIFRSRLQPAPRRQVITGCLIGVRIEKRMFGYPNKASPYFFREYYITGTYSKAPCEIEAPQAQLGSAPGNGGAG